MIHLFRSAAVAALVFGCGTAAAQFNAPAPGATNAQGAVTERREKESSYNKAAGELTGRDAEKKDSEELGPVLAPRAEITAGKAFRDVAGVPVGTIETVEADGAVVRVGTALAKIPFESFGKDKQGLLLGITKAELEAAMAPAVAAAAAEAAAANAQARAQASTPAAGKLVIYDTGPASGWEVSSSAAVEVGAVLNGSARRPIIVDAGPGQSVALTRAPFSTTGYRKLGFLIQGAAPGGQKVRVVTLSGGKPTGEGKVVTVGTKGWTQVEVPLATLGAEDKTVDGFAILNPSDQALPRFYVTDIVLN